MSHGSLLGEIGSVGSRIELNEGSGISHTITDIYLQYLSSNSGTKRPASEFHRDHVLN